MLNFYRDWKDAKFTANHMRWCRFFSLNIYFKNFNCILSITSQFPNPHASTPYNNIGLIVLSKRSSCKSSGRFKVLLLLIIIEWDIDDALTELVNHYANRTLIVSCTKDCT